MTARLARIAPAARIALGLTGAAAAIAFTPGVAFAGPGPEAPQKTPPATAPAAPTPAAPSADQKPMPAPPVELPTAVPAGSGGEAGTTSDTTRNATIGSGIAGAVLVAGSGVTLLRRRLRGEGSH